MENFIFCAVLKTKLAKSFSVLADVKYMLLNSLSYAYFLDSAMHLHSKTKNAELSMSSLKKWCILWHQIITHPTHSLPQVFFKFWYSVLDQTFFKGMCYVLSAYEKIVTSFILVCFVFFLPGCFYQFYTNNCHTVFNVLQV